MRTEILLLPLALACTGPSWGQEPGGTTPAPGRFPLKNGLTAIVRPIRGANEVALLVLYKLGGDHDPQGRSGLAHLVEHVYVTAAAGSAPARSADAFLQSYPSGCNAQTGERHTVIATVFPKADLEKELTEAAARMGDLRIMAADLDREKPRLLAELANMFGRIPALGALNHARELIRPAPRGGRKGGLPEHVQAMTLDDVKTHWARYYKPRNAILVLAGAVDEPSARRAVAAQFAQLDPGVEPPPPGEPRACLAYAVPEPGCDLYAPFLLLVARLWTTMTQPGGDGGPGRTTIDFPLLEDPAVLGVSGAAKAGETAAQALARLEAFVAQTTAPRLRDEERAAARQVFGFFLGTADLPDFALAHNPYGVALGLARREQLGFDPARLNRALDTLTETEFRRAASEIFAPSRHAGAFLRPGR